MIFYITLTPHLHVSPHPSPPTILTHRNNGRLILPPTGRRSPHAQHRNRPPSPDTCACVWPLHIPRCDHHRPRAVGHVCTVRVKRFDPSEVLRRPTDLCRYLDRGLDAGVLYLQVRNSIRSSYCDTNKSASSVGTGSFITRDTAVSAFLSWLR